MQRHAKLQDGYSVKTSNIAAAALIAALATAASGIPARADVIEARSEDRSGSWTQIPSIWTFTPPVPGQVYPDNDNVNSFDVLISLPSFLTGFILIPTNTNISVNNIDYGGDRGSFIISEQSSLNVAGRLRSAYTETIIGGTLITNNLAIDLNSIFRITSSGTVFVSGLVTADLGYELIVDGVMFAQDIQERERFDLNVTVSGKLSAEDAEISTLAVPRGEVTATSIKGLYLMRIEEGGRVTVSDDLEFAGPPQPTPGPGALVDGPDSRLTIGRNLVIPEDPVGVPPPAGTFNITNGARVTVGTDADITDTAVVIDAASSMTVGNVFKLTESTLMVEGRLTTGTLVVDPSTVTLGGGVINGDVLLDAGSRLEGTGTIDGTVTVQGGELAPGLSIGTLTIVEDLLFESGLLEIQVDVTDRNTFVVDLIEVLGTATLSDVDLVIMFTGAGILDQGTMIEFLTAGELLQFDVRSVQVLGLEYGFIGLERMLGEDGGLSLIALTEVKVPEPATMLIFAFGLAGIGAAARRRRAA